MAAITPLARLRDAWRETAQRVAPATLPPVEEVRLAERATTDRLTLAVIARLGSPRARLAIARRGDCTPGRLARLARGGGRELREAVAAHPAIGAGTWGRLWAEGGRALRRRLLVSPRAPRALLERVLAGEMDAEDPLAREVVLARGALDGERLLDLCRTEGASGMATLARRADLPLCGQQMLLSRLLSDPTLDEPAREMGARMLAGAERLDAGVAATLLARWPAATLENLVSVPGLPDALFRAVSWEGAVATADLGSREPWLRRLARRRWSDALDGSAAEREGRLRELVAVDAPAALAALRRLAAAGGVEPRLVAIVLAAEDRDIRLEAGRLLGG